MKGLRLFRPLLRRETRGMLANRVLAVGWLFALALGLGVSGFTSAAETRLWILYQLIYYLLPLAAILGTIMIARQDRAEAPLLAFLPGSLGYRVLAKAVVAQVYLVGAVLLVLAPCLVRGLSGSDALGLFAGGVAIAAVFSALGVAQAMRSRHEVRAYLGGLLLWVLFLFGSGALGYASQVWMGPRFSPSVTLFALMANPLESFRILVFFGLSAVPMNPQTLHPVAGWWLAHPMIWLGALSVPYVGLALAWAGQGLRYRAEIA